MDLESESRQVKLWYSMLWTDLELKCPKQNLLFFKNVVGYLRLEKQLNHQTESLGHMPSDVSESVDGLDHEAGTALSDPSSGN